MEWSKKLYLKNNEDLVNVCIAWGITANQITIFNHFITLTLGVYCFSRGTWLFYLLALAIMIINGILDYLDGDIAKKTNTVSKLGIWLDSGFDVIIQNVILGAIAIGCIKAGLSYIWIVLFYIANSANNLVGFHYNAQFGFDSVNGNEMFRLHMDSKPTLFNRFIKNVIDPTSNIFGLFFFTFRYWIVLGCLFNIMPICFIIMTIISNVKWIILYIIYAFHQVEYKKLWVSQALAIIDEERQEFYNVRKL